MSYHPQHTLTWTCKWTKVFIDLTPVHQYASLVCSDWLSWCGELHDLEESTAALEEKVISRSGQLRWKKTQVVVVVVVVAMEKVCNFVNVPLFVHLSFNFLSLLLLDSMSQVSGPTQLCRGESGSQHHTYGQFRSAGSLKCMSQLRLRQDVADLQPTFRSCVQPSRHSQFLSSSSAVKPAFCWRVCCCKDDRNSAWCCQTCLKPLWCSRLLTHCQSTRGTQGTYGGNNHFNQCNKMFIPKD